MSTPPVAVCWVSAETALASPKSATLTRPSSAISTFSGLTSRWIRPAAVRVRERGEHRLDEGQRPRRRHRALLADHVAQGVPGDVLHHQEDGAVVVALVEDRDHVGVVEPGGRARLAHEPGRELLVVAQPGVHHLDRAARGPAGGRWPRRRWPCRRGRCADRSGSGRRRPARRGGRSARRHRLPVAGAPIWLHSTLLRTGRGRIRSAHRTDASPGRARARPPRRGASHRRS